MNLLVRLHGRVVGVLVERSTGAWVFRFDERFLASADQPVLGRWFEDQDKAALEYRSRWRGVLPAFFQNYLPDRDSPLRKQLAAGADVSEDAVGALLAFLGEDLPGAIAVSTINDADVDPEDVLEDLQDHEPLRDPPVHQDEPLHFSLAGMQLKYSVWRDEQGRFTVPVRGVGGRWLLKLPYSERLGVPYNEHAMLTLARAVGISVPEFMLVRWREVEGLPRELDFSDSHALVIRRYDRAEDGVRIHQEDFAQVFDILPSDKYPEGSPRGKNTEPVLSYASIGRVIWRVCGADDFVEYVRRLVFIVLTGNADAHLKNWSLVYPDRLRPRLSPAYDLVAVSAVDPQFRRLALKLAGKREFPYIRREHFLRLAELCHAEGVDIAATVAETVDRFKVAWSGQKNQFDMLDAHRQRLDEHLRGLSLDADS